jgi:hypothetical protein
MTKISNQYSLTNILTADLANSRLGINNVSPTVALDVTGAGKFSGVLTLGSTISNGTLTYTLPSATGTLALTSALSGTTNYVSKFTSSGTIGNSSIQDLTTGVLVSPSVTAASAIARGTYLTPTLVASANGDTLVGLDINPTFTNGAFTGVSQFAIRVIGTIRAAIFDSATNLRFSSGTISSYINFALNQTSTEIARFHGTTGNLTLQNGGTFTDAGYRLDVTGTARVSGAATFSSSVSATSYNATTQNIFAVDGSEKMRITSAGNVGIGTTTPRTAATGTNATLDIKGGIYFGSTNSESCTLNNDDSMIFNIDADNSSTSNFFRWATNTKTEDGGTELMRLKENGNLLVGTTTETGLTTGSSVNVGISLGGGIIASQVNNNSNQYWSKATGYTSGDFTAHFVNTTYVGGISTNGSTTNYAVASDYRLKEDLKDFVGIDLINRIKAYDYQWKSDKTRMYGVVAHEFAEVLSYAVTGQKDEDRMQGVDYSKIVPVLVKAIQELSAEITILKNK